VNRKPLAMTETTTEGGSGAPAAPASPSPTPAQATPPSAPPTTDPATPPAAPAQATTDWQAEAKKWEQRSKENFEKAKQFDALTEAQKTDAQKQAERIAELEGALPKATVDAFKQAAVAFGGVSQEDADLFLTASDPETLMKQAQALSALKSTPPVAPQTPPPTAGVQGNVGTPLGGPDKPIATRIAEAEVELSKLAPGSPEAKAARQAVSSLKAQQLAEQAKSIR